MDGTTALRVRVRPNSAHLTLLAVGATVIIVGSVMGGVVGFLLAGCGCVLTLLLGLPVLASTVLRVPALVVGPDGVRFPLMGVGLGWAEIAAVQQGVRMRGASQTPVLLVVPQDPAVAIRRMRPWLRREARNDLAALGTPLVLDDRSLDHTLAEISDAVRAHTPAP